MESILANQTSLALLQASEINTPNAEKLSQNTNRLEESSREFEAVFIAEMMKPMFEGIETDGLFKGNKGEDIFRGIMLQEYGKEIASLNIIGVQGQVKNKLIELQAINTTGNK